MRRTELAWANDYAERNRATKPQILWVEALAFLGTYMRRGSLIQRYSYLVHLGVLLTQLLQKERGFRLKDVKFYCSLVSNWISFDGQGYEFDIELMQIKRLLQSLEEKNWIHLKVVDKKKYYHLNRKGFLGLLESFRQKDEMTSMEEALLLYYTLKTYQPFLVDYLLNDDKKPDAERVRALIHPDWFIEDYIEKLDKRIQMIQIRIEENSAMTDFIQASMESGESFSSIVDRVHKKFSYQMSYAKTFKELLLEIPEELGLFELQHGLSSRNDILFTALRDTYEQRKLYLRRHLSQRRADK